MILRGIPPWKPRTRRIVFFSLSQRKPNFLSPLHLHIIHSKKVALSNYSPREFLKARRPERFSDSVMENQPALDRAILEYYLETLTNRSQETDFQNFARHL